MNITRRQLNELIRESLNLSEENKDAKIGQYKVKDGDTLSGITAKHSPKGFTSADNAKLNKISADDIKAGTFIDIYVTDEYEGEMGPL